jgi:peptide/nickel transport system permease protein
MWAFIVRRLIQAVLIILLVTIIIFFAMRFLPGDPVLVYVSGDTLTSSSPEQIAAIRHEFGLDLPIAVQYINWLGDVLQGNLGKSIILRSSVNVEIASALPKTIYMGSIAFILSIVLGIPLGIIAAVRRGKWIDTLSTLFANLGVTAPVFWVGIIMVLIFGLYLHWLPIQGFVWPGDNFGKSISSIVMPVACLTLYPMATIARQTRSAMLEVIRQDYIRTAMAKGLSERAIIIKHATRNGIIPVITLIGLNIRQIFGGQVLVEKVFNIPGMGRLSVDALFSQDYAIVQGVILVIALVVVIANLLVDLSYGWIDPRIRYD